MDRSWWNEYGGEIRGEFEMWTSHREAARVYGLNFIESEPGGGVCRKPGKIRHGGNSGFQAVSLALHFGAARVVLLGFDMQITAGRTHWHGDHRGQLGNPVQKRMAIWLDRFGQMAAESAVPIVNATRQTALQCFPRIDLHESLAKPETFGT